MGRNRFPKKTRSLVKIVKNKNSGGPGSTTCRILALVAGFRPASRTRLRWPSAGGLSSSLILQPSKSSRSSKNSQTLVDELGGLGFRFTFSLSSPNRCQVVAVA